MVSLCKVFCSGPLIYLPHAKYSPKELVVKNTLRYITPWGSDTIVTKIRVFTVVHLPLFKNKEIEHKVFLNFSLYVNKKNGGGGGGQGVKKLELFFVKGPSWVGDFQHFYLMTIMEIIFET